MKLKFGVIKEQTFSSVLQRGMSHETSGRAADMRGDVEIDPEGEWEHFEA